MAKLPVKVFFSTDKGAPVVSGGAGALLRVLNACLVTGFNAIPARAISWVDGVATLILDAGHGYKYPDVIDISGSAPAAFDGEYRVTGAGDDWVTFECASAPSSISGATIKRASLGWLTKEVGVNISAYYIADEFKRRSAWVIDDTNTLPKWNNGLFQKSAIAGWNSISDDGVLSGKWKDGVWIPKARQNVDYEMGGISTGGDRPWTVIGDDEMVYILIDLRGLVSSVQSPIPDGFGYEVCCFGNATTFRGDFDLLTPMIAGNIYNGAYSNHVQARGGLLGDAAGVYMHHAPDANYSSGAARVFISPCRYSGVGGANKEYQENLSAIRPMLTYLDSCVAQPPGLFVLNAKTGDINGWKGSKISGRYMLHRAVAAKDATYVEAALYYIGAIAFDILGPWR